MLGIEAQRDVIVFEELFTLGREILEGCLRRTQQIVPHAVFAKTLRLSLIGGPDKPEPVRHAACDCDEDGDREQRYDAPCDDDSSTHA